MHVSSVRWEGVNRSKYVVLQKTISAFFLVSLLSSLRDQSLFILYDALVSHPNMFSVISSLCSLPLLPPAHLNLIRMPHQLHRIEYWFQFTIQRISHNKSLEEGEYLDFPGPLSRICRSLGRVCTVTSSRFNPFPVPPNYHY